MRSGEAWHFVIAQYLDCAEEVPLSQRMAELEKKVAELEFEVRSQTVDV